MAMRHPFDCFTEFIELFRFIGRKWFMALAPLMGLVASGCGTPLDELLSGVRLLPDPAIISLDVHDNCDAVMTEDEILTSILAARIDQSNGVTKAEEESTAFQSCAIEALFGGTDITECNNCKLAILDQVFGESVR
jgi:hypothetical protein